MRNKLWFLNFRNHHNKGIINKRNERMIYLNLFDKVKQRVNNLIPTMLEEDSRVTILARCLMRTHIKQSSFALIRLDIRNKFVVVFPHNIWISGPRNNRVMTRSILFKEICTEIPHKILQDIWVINPSTRVITESNFFFTPSTRLLEPKALFLVKGYRKLLVKLLLKVLKEATIPILWLFWIPFNLAKSSFFLLTIFPKVSMFHSFRWGVRLEILWSKSKRLSHFSCIRLLKSSWVIQATSNLKGRSTPFDNSSSEITIIGWWSDCTLGRTLAKPSSCFNLHFTLQKTWSNFLKTLSRPFHLGPLQVNLVPIVVTSINLQSFIQLGKFKHFLRSGWTPPFFSSGLGISLKFPIIIQGSWILVASPLNWYHIVSLSFSQGVDGVVESLLIARVVEMKMKLFFMCFVIASTLLRYGFTSFLLIL